MPRPRKCRKVCCLPQRDIYGPLNVPVDENYLITMTVDEYETIRLIDLEGFTQEECANQMSIARTTVQGVYNNARKKLAESLVNGKALRIEGGDYKLCSEFEKSCGCPRCCRHRYNNNFVKNEDKNV